MDSAYMLPSAGPKTTEDLARFYEARTQGMVTEAFYEIEARLDELTRRQIDEAKNGLADGLCVLAISKRHQVERKFLMLLFVSKWGTSLSKDIVAGLGKDIEDYGI